MHRSLYKLGLVPPVLAAITACMPLPHGFEPVEEFPIRSASVHTPAPFDPTEIRVMTWNLKFGGARVDFFFDGWGERVHMSEREVDAHMDGILYLIDEVQPDILLAQEVDVNSTRSAYVDMVDVILESGHFNAAAWVPAWDVDYVPEEGLGKVEMGQAVFSRWPIVRNTRVDLPQSTESSALINQFNLRRAIQITEIDTGTRVVSVVNNHPTAYDLDGTKTIHLEMIYDWSVELFPPVVVGGDFNVIPPGSLQTSDFADNAPADVPGVTEVSYSVDEMAALLPFYERWEETLPLLEYQSAPDLEAQSVWFTHSVSADVFWTQRLDYLFTDARWAGAWTLQSPGDGDRPILSDPMQLSDHAPVVGVLELP